jgi:subtilisin family serine protease
MSKKLTVKSGKGELRLKKSKKLVGLKPKNQDRLESADFVEEKYFDNLGGFEIVSLNKEEKDLDKELDKVRQKEEVELGTHVYLAEGSKNPLVPTGEIIITYEDGTNQEEQQLVLDEFYLALVERRSASEVIAKVTEKSPNPLKVANFLQKISLVKQAEPDLDTILDEYDFQTPADNLLSHQWYLRNIGIISDANYRIKKGADAKIIDAWTRIGNPGSSNITIAVVDNGFDLSHPDLKTKVVKPFDLWNQSSNLVQGNPRYTHGTPCASVALASINGSGIVGVAPNSKFMPVSGTSFSLRATEQMFDYCVKNGADIISCSWGTTDPNFSLNRLKEEAISRAARKGRNGKGSIILFAAGNDGKDFLNFYATHPDVIAVGATTSQDVHARYSNKGRELSVVAPSNGDWPIIAARAWWDQGNSRRGSGNFKYWADGRSRGNHYKHFGGTSSSTPLVAGICALMLSVNPDLTAREVKEILQKTADKVGHAWEYNNGHSDKYGYGRVNADRAVAEAMRRRETSSPPTGIPRPQPVDPSPTPTPTPRPSPSTPTGGISQGEGLFRFSVKRQSHSGWGIQVGVYADYANVLMQAERYERQFNAPIVVNINESGGKTIYKVIVGAFQDKSQARNLLSQISGAGLSGFLRNLKDL